MSGTRRSPDPGGAARARLRAGVALSLVEGVGCVGFRARVEQHGSAHEALAATVSSATREAALRDAEGLVARAEASGARICVLGEADYPERLLELADPPPVLYALGDLSLLQRRSVAIVGMRHSSPGGDRIARMMAREVTTRDAVVVSGMARGIDAAAHEGALDEGGGTVAVLGGGVDVPYPPKHRALHARLAAHGLLLSENEPGLAPPPGAFPKRNRLIAALAHAVLVVEAGVPSGALITAEIALELGRPVGALPGAIDSPRATGTNRLIRDGAAIITGAEDVFALADLPRAPRQAARGPHACAAEMAVARTPPDDSATAVLAAIRSGASDVDQVSDRTRLSVRDVNAAVVALELAGALAPSVDGTLHASL